MKVYGFDCDGVITVGIRPRNCDIIITGRSFQEKLETQTMLEVNNITNQVYYNELPFIKKTRKTSGLHKVKTIKELAKRGIHVVRFFEDDPIQWEIIEQECPEVEVVKIVHDLTEKENVRHIGEN